jgi:hypothetical protein
MVITKKKCCPSPDPCKYGISCGKKPQLQITIAPGTTIYSAVGQLFFNVIDAFLTTQYQLAWIQLETFSFIVSVSVGPTLKIYLTDELLAFFTDNPGYITVPTTSTQAVFPAATVLQPLILNLYY